MLVPHAPFRLEFAFRGVGFGNWEGLTREEIEAADPAGYAEGMASDANFHFPVGESRAAFRARIAQGYERLSASGARSALVWTSRGSCGCNYKH